MGFLSWLWKFSERRQGWRMQASGITAFYWTGGRPTPRAIRDIGPGGAYIVAPDTPYPGTLLQIVLEDTSRPGAGQLCVSAEVKRRVADGFCVNFLLSSARARYEMYQFLMLVKNGSTVESGGASGAAEDAAKADEADATRRLLRGDSGQSLVEFALLLPLILLLIVNVVNFGGMLYAWITVSSAARTGAQYLITGPAAIGSPVTPAASAVQTLVLADVHALPNSPSAQVCVSRSGSATVSCNTGSAPVSAPPAAETAEGSPAITYIVGAVDVTYTYLPLIPLWDFRALHIHATLPPTTIHRQAVMRILQ